MIALLQIFILIKSNYDFDFEKEFIKIFIFQLFLAILSLIVLLSIEGYLFYISGILIIVISIIYSLKELDRRIDLFSRISLLNKLKI